MQSYPEWRAEFESTLLSALSNDGFQRFAHAHYGRIRDDVLQFLVVQSEAMPDAKVWLEFGSLLLVEPHSFLNLDLGGCFPDGDAGKVYVIAGTGEAVRSAVEAVVIDYLTICRPVLQRMLTFNGFIAATTIQLQNATTPHPAFTLAAAYARKGALDESEHFAKQALNDYVAQQAKHNHAWAKRGEERCSRLLKSLYTGTTTALQDGWRAGSIAALGVGSLVDER